MRSLCRNRAGPLCDLGRAALPPGSRAELDVSRLCILCRRGEPQHGLRGLCQAVPGGGHGVGRGGHSLTGRGPSLVRAVFPPHCGAQTPKALSCLEITALQWVWKKLRPCRGARPGQQVALFPLCGAGAHRLASRQHRRCGRRGLCRRQALGCWGGGCSRTAPLQDGPRPWTCPPRSLQLA